MPRTQQHPIGNEVKASVLQYNLEELFQLAHSHMVKTSLPAPSEGSPEDVAIVDDGTNVYLCVKTTRGWFRTAALTAI